MEVLKKSDLLKVNRERIKKIIFCMVIVISITIFSFNFSANEVVYLDKIISASDFASLTYANSSVRYGYSDLSNYPFLSLFGSSSSINYQKTYDLLPYSANGFINGSSLYWQGVYFTNSGNEKRIIYGLSPVFDLYFDDFTFDFYILLPLNYNSINIQYLDGADSQFYNVTYSLTYVYGDLLQNIRNRYPDIISQSYINYVSQNHYFTNQYGNNVDLDLTQSTIHLYKVSCNFTGLDKTQIRSILINITYARNIDNAPRIFPYIYFASNIDCFIKSNQDEVYSQTLANQERLIAQQQAIINQLDEITGEPSSENQGTIDDIQTDYREKASELQDDIDIIHSVEFPTEEPTSVIPSSDLEYISEVIAPIFEDLSSLQIFNIIVPTGCVGFLVYIVLRRF